MSRKELNRLGLQIMGLQLARKLLDLYHQYMSQIYFIIYHNECEFFLPLIICLF